MDIKICLMCGENFTKKDYRAQKSWESAKYCSNKCRGDSMKGRPTWNKGKKTGLVPWNKGTKGVMRGWNKGLKMHQTSGDKNGNWTGKDDKYWKKQTLERDNWTCQSCGLREPEIMQVDHIKSKMIFPEFRFEMDNLQTLCPNCHARKTIQELKSGISYINRLKN
jgi:5-methylcytosine-specific restriction endonuclease McrA